MCLLKLFSAVEPVSGNECALFFLMENGLNIHKANSGKVKFHSCALKFLVEHRHVKAVGIEAGYVAPFKYVRK